MGTIIITYNLCLTVSQSVHRLWLWLGQWLGLVLTTTCGRIYSPRGLSPAVSHLSIPPSLTLIMSEDNYWVGIIRNKFRRRHQASPYARPKNGVKKEEPVRTFVYEA